MRDTIQRRWIEEAEAKAFGGLARAYRAPSEPHIGLAGGAATAPFGWLHRLAAAAARTIVARASSAHPAACRGAPCDALCEFDCDRILAAVLITDIVASTKRVADMGDRPWRRLLDRHDDAARLQIRRFGGTEVRNNGDGFLVVFDSPTRAVRCAAAIAEITAPLGIAVRSGVHCGEIHLKRHEISGLSVHVTARIASIARPSEVLVSKTVRDLVVGSGLRFEDRGIHTLRGVPEHAQLYAMHAGDDTAGAAVINLKDRVPA